MKKNQDSIVWYDARQLKEEQNSILELVYNGWYQYMIVTIDQYKKLKMPKKMKPIVFVTDLKDTENLEKETMVMAEEPKLLQKLQDTGFKAVLLAKVYDGASMEQAKLESVNFAYCIIELKDKTNIPLELLIASLQSTNTVIMKVISSLNDAKIALAIMEVGCDGVVLRTEDMEQISKLNGLMLEQEKGKMEIVNVKVIRVEHVGRGNRICVDTTAVLHQNEGMIIGSTSRGGLLISSETHYLPYMDLRPFRVNAGALHSYTWSVDNTTKYLSDLKVGSTVLAVDTNGNTREVCVGRIKMEERPMLLIGAEYKGVKINSIVQDDWHIRLFGKDGKVVNSSDIKPGDELLGYLCEGGRHVGIKINEALEEQ